MNIFIMYFNIFILVILLSISGNSCAPKNNTSAPEKTNNPENTEESTNYEVSLDRETVYPNLGNYEPYPVFKASEILDPDILKGEHYEVVEEVKNDCIWNSYIIKSDFGEYRAHNTKTLETRINEINATAKLKKISGGQALATGAADTVINPFRSAINMASKPVDTAKGVPGGIVTFFKKIYYSGEKVVTVTGQTAKNVGGTVIGSGDENSEGGETFSDLTGNVAYLTDWYLGISGGERRAAKKVGVDPYTSNPELAAELNRVAKYDRIGRLGFGFMDVPSVPGMGYVKDVNHYVWDKDPKELREFNRINLLEMGINEEFIETFLDSPYYSPTLQTTIVFSLMQLPEVANREEVIEDAVVASSISESSYFTNIVLLLVWFNNTQSPLTEIINHGDITSGMSVDNKIVTIIPVDYLCWSEKVAGAANFHNQVFSDIEADARELWIVGEISERAALELDNLGWEVHEQISIEDEPVSVEIDKNESTKGINKKAFDIFKEEDSGTNNIQTED